MFFWPIVGVLIIERFHVIRERIYFHRRYNTNLSKIHDCMIKVFLVVKENILYRPIAEDEKLSYLSLFYKRLSTKAVRNLSSEINVIFV